MLRNIASQKWRVYAWDATTGLAKTGDAANISARITKDDGTPAATNDAAPTEVHATNEPGYYDFDLLQAETAAAKLSLSPKSSTANIQVIAAPPVVYTVPQYLSLLGIASDGDVTKVNALDGHTAQTGDSFGIVNNGTHGNANLKALIDAVDLVADGIKAVTDLHPNAGAFTDLATLAARLTAARAGYLDNLNVGGNVASSAEVTAIQNSTRSKAVQPSFIERPDAGSVTPELFLFLYDTAGQMEDATGTPTIAITNSEGTDRSGNLSAVTNPGTGQYQATYTVAAAHAIEHLQGTWSYVEGGQTIVVPFAFTVVDTTAVDFTAADRTKLDTLHDSRLTAARAGYLDNLNGHTPQTGDGYGILNSGAHGNAALKTLIDTIDVIVDTLVARLTAARAGYLDNLSGHTPQTGDAFLRLATYRLGELLSAALASQPFAESLLADLTEDDAGTQRFSANALEQAPSGSGATVEEIDAELTANHGAGPWTSAGAGSGARVITITIDDGTDPLESVRVRATKGAETYLQTTDVAGQVVFNLDDGTWTIVATLPGYTLAAQSLVVGADAGVTYSMTLVVTPTASPDQVTGFITCYDENGDPEQDVIIKIIQTGVAAATGLAHDKAERSATSDVNGLVQFPGLFIGATYRISRGTTRTRYKLTIPSGAPDPVELTSLIGES